MRALWFLLTVSFYSVPCYPAVVQLGTLSFDVLLPGSGVSPGVNRLVIANLTGDPASGGFAVPDAFPVVDVLTFQNSKLTLAGSVSTTIALGDLGPGFHSSSELEFADTVQFTSALFTAGLDHIDLVLHGGGILKAVSRGLAVTLGPSLRLQPHRRRRRQRDSRVGRARTHRRSAGRRGSDHPGRPPAPIRSKTHQVSRVNHQESNRVSEILSVRSPAGRPR